MDPTLLILDVREKETGQAAPPSFPQPKPSTTTGFPQPKKRVSAFKQQQQQQQQQKQGNKTATEQENTTRRAAAAPTATRSQDAAATSPSPPTAIPQQAEQLEKQRIDRENRERLQNMSADEIEEARRELFNNLDPSLLQRLLKRANLDEPTGAPSPFDEPTPKIRVDGPPAAAVAAAVAGGDDDDDDDDVNQVAAAPPPPPPAGEPKPKKTVSFAFDEDAAPAASPTDLFPIASSSSDGPDKPPPPHHHPDGFHFPRPPPGAASSSSSSDLDPADPNFLQTLHEKYFPNLPADPSKLAWMAPVPTEGSVADHDSPYHPGRSSLPVSQLRFDFSGRLLPPRVSRAIPVTKGLHHHGEAPEAAGYTVPELARLARSAVPAQRCLAFQTLGRILFRLGKGEWGGADDQLASGLWRCLEDGRVLDSLNEAASVEEGRGHRGSRAYATEAVWLFEKGGWREKWKRQKR